MFTITYQNNHYRQWTDRFIFEDLETAKEYLKKQGYVENNRMFEQVNRGWSVYTKAYITRREVYRDNSKGEK